MAIIKWRARLARNFADIPFTGKSKEEQRNEVVRRVEASLNTTAKAVSALPAKEKAYLIEQRFISTTLAANSGHFIYNYGDGTVVMINEEDHLRIQSFGLDPEACMHKVFELAQEIGKQFDYAYHPRYGYVSKCITNFGSGLRLSALIHVPALEFAPRIITKLKKKLAGHGVLIRGSWGENTPAMGDVVQLATGPQLNSPQILLAQFTKIVNNIINLEGELVKQAREGSLLTKQGREKLQRDVEKTLAIIKSAEKITHQDGAAALSRLRLAVLFGLVQLPVSEKQILALFDEIGPATLQMHNDKARSASELRAIKLREALML